MELTMQSELVGVYQLAQADVARLGIDFNVPDQYAIHYARTRAADLVSGIQETTKARLNRLIAQGLEDGMTPTELRDAIIRDFQFSVDRAQLIARTEMAMAYNAGQLESLKTSNTPAVKVLDGMSADTDDACRRANGKIISIGLAMQYLIQHPNCVRSFSPVVVEPGEAVDLQDDEFLAAVESE